MRDAGEGNRSVEIVMGENNKDDAKKSKGYETEKETHRVQRKSGYAMTKQIIQIEQAVDDINHHE